MYLICTQYRSEIGKQKVVWWGRYNKFLACDPTERPSKEWFESYSYETLDHVFNRAKKLPTTMMLNDFQNYDMIGKQLYNIRTNKFKPLEGVVICKNN